MTAPSSVGDHRRSWTGGVVALLLLAATAASAQTVTDIPHSGPEGAPEDPGVLKELYCRFVDCDEQSVHDLPPPANRPDPADPSRFNPPGSQVEGGQDDPELDGGPAADALTGFCGDGGAAVSRAINDATAQRLAAAHARFQAALRAEQRQINAAGQAELAAIAESAPEGDHFAIFVPMKPIFNRRDRTQQRIRGDLEAARRRHAAEYHAATAEIHQTAATLHANVRTAASRCTP